MPDKLQFNGEDRIINILPGITFLDTRIDIYSAWKRWAASENNLKYPQALRTFGGDQTISGQFAPRYFFLTNGWRINVNDGRDLLVGVNLYTDELDSPFIVQNNSTVSLNNSDAAVVDSEISENLDYNGVVNVNPNIGLDETQYPAGTLARPVNNIENAKIIAERYGILKINIFGETHISTDLQNYVVVGGNLNDVVIFHNDVNVDKTTFIQCTLEGSYTGEIAADNCILQNNLNGMHGYFQKCGFLGKMYFKPGAICVLNDCHSQVPGLNSPELHLDENVQLSLRKYSGGLAIYDTKEGTTATLEFIVGNCRLLTGNTGGKLVIRGLATLTDESTGTDVLIDGLITPNQKVFGGQIG